MDATSADPQSSSLYSYTQNDPVNFVDPSGLEFVICSADMGYGVCEALNGGGLFGGSLGGGRSGGGTLTITTVSHWWGDGWTIDGTTWDFVPDFGGFAGGGSGGATTPGKPPTTRKRPNNTDDYEQRWLACVREVDRRHAARVAEKWKTLRNTSIVPTRGEAVAIAAGTVISTVRGSFTGPWTGLLSGGLALVGGLTSSTFGKLLHPAGDLFFTSNFDHLWVGEREQCGVSPSERRRRHMS